MIPDRLSEALEAAVRDAARVPDARATAPPPPAVPAFGPRPPIQSSRSERPPRNAREGRLPHLATTMEIAVPALLLRPQVQGAGARDLRNETLPPRAELARFDATTPVVARLEAWGEEAAGGWAYTETPKTGRYPGGVAAGGLCVLPGNVGLEQILGTGRLPDTLEVARVAFPPALAAAAFATPTAAGDVRDGFEVLATASLFTIDGINSTSVRDADAPLQLNRELAVGAIFGRYIAATSGEGTSGQVVQSAGSGTPPAWAWPGKLYSASGTKRVEADATGLGFFGVAPVARPTVTGSRGGNAALASLLTELANEGLIVDGTSA